MKKFKGEKDVVLVMSKKEFSDLDLLVAAGICYYHNDSLWSSEEMSRFRTLRDNLKD